MEQRIQERQEGSFEMKVTEIKLESLDVVYHPRKNLGDLESLQRSIRRDGLQEPLLVYPLPEGRFGIIDGYRRLSAIKEFGWENAPCIIKEVTQSDAAHFSYVKNVERNEFTAIEVALHLKAMQFDFGYSLRDLEMKGYGAPQSISRKLKLLELPESVQTKVSSGELSMAHGLAITKLGSPEEQERWAGRIVDEDLTFKKAENQIDRYLKKGKKTKPAPRPFPKSQIPGVYFKDSRDMSELPDKSVHLIVSSPPYFVGMEYEKGMTFNEHLDMIGDVMKECSRVLAKGGVIALNVGDIHNFKGPKGNNEFRQVQLMGHNYQSFLRKYGITLSDVIIWQKNDAWRKYTVSHQQDMPHTSYRMMLNWDPVYIFRKKGEREVPSEEIVLQSVLSRQQWISWVPSVWKIDPVKNMDGHPSIYPDELVRRLVLMFSYVGDTVLDPFLGSGTTVKVARELGREAVGYEREPKYKEVIIRRLSEQANVDNTATELFIENMKNMVEDGREKDLDQPAAPELWKPEPEMEANALMESLEVGEAE